METLMTGMVIGLMIGVIMGMVGTAFLNVRHFYDFVSFEIDPEDVGKALDYFKSIPNENGKVVRRYDFSVNDIEKIIIGIDLRKIPFFKSKYAEIDCCTAEIYRMNNEKNLKKIGVNVIRSYVA